MTIQLLDGEGDTAPENFGNYSFIEHDRFDFFTSEGRTDQLIKCLQNGKVLIVVSRNKSYFICALCLSLSYCLVCSLQPCDNLLGKG